jgi:hexokinase
MHDVPKDLMKQIRDLEQQFTVDTEKLHEIVAKFQAELEKGKLPDLFPWAVPALEFVLITRVL